jgi:hypothetical protein
MMKRLNKIEKPKKQHPPDDPKDRFIGHKGDFKIYDKDGNLILPNEKPFEPPKPKAELPKEN